MAIQKKSLTGDRATKKAKSVKARAGSLTPKDLKLDKRDLVVVPKYYLKVGC
jgi:hypothetical protein